MTGVGIAYGTIGAATIVAILYMMEHGYTWWQVALMALLGMALLPHYRHEERKES